MQYILTPAAIQDLEKLTDYLADAEALDKEIKAQLAIALF